MNTRMPSSGGGCVDRNLVPVATSGAIVRRDYRADDTLLVGLSGRRSSVRLRRIASLGTPAVLMCMLVTGCALTSKSAPLELRFFTPHAVDRDLRTMPAKSSGLALRLGRIESGAHIDQRIAFRRSETELGYYQALRWTEPPAFYLRNELAAALFDERGVSRIVSGIGPTLDLELIEFEELQFGARRARVGLRFVLRDEQRALVDQVVVVEKAFLASDGGGSDESLAQAMSSALAEATSTVANRVVQELETIGVEELPGCADRGLRAKQPLAP